MLIYKKITNKTLIIKFAIISFIAFFLRKFRVAVYRLRGYDIAWSVIVEKVNLDRLYPTGIHIKEHCLIASGVTILSHDHCKRVNNQPLLADVHIGKNCFIAVGATIMPGVTIGDECIVGAGAVVTRDVPPNAIVAGNPAKIIRTGITMNERAEWSNWSKTK